MKHVLTWSEEQVVKEFLRDNPTGDGSINMKKLAELCSVSTQTVRNAFGTLVKHGMVKIVSHGRNGTIVEKLIDNYWRGLVA